MISSPDSLLVSVVIPCFNHGKFLAESINSVLDQTYSPIEIIVVNDGSTDNTKEVAGAFPMVKYVYQENQGLSAARNAGIKNSEGEFLVFLDADDLLLKDAIDFNQRLLLDDISLAFVSGGYNLETADYEIIPKQRIIDTNNAYLLLLERNYIEMHGTVMYRRWVFEEFLFDTSLKACEDYDLYLKIARNHPVAHHSKILTVYRMHGNNMSGNPKLMLDSVLEVLRRQKKVLKSKEEAESLKRGIEFFEKYYVNKLIKKVKTSGNSVDKPSLRMLWKYNKKFSVKIFIRKIINRIITIPWVEDNVPDSLKKRFFRLGFYKNYFPPVTKVDFGDLYRVKPFSKEFGDDRGGAIDRYYVEKFLAKNSQSIYGKVLEVADNAYTLGFGREKVTFSEILDIESNNPKATLVADLRNAPHIPNDTYDCIILTQMLHFVYEYQDVINTCYRILKPGGILLLTVPGISPIDYDDWEHYWHWSFTKRVIEKILSEIFDKNKIEVSSYGNVFSAASFLFGVGLPEVKKDMLDYNDPHVQVIVSAKAKK
ncbi:glycosyltransferase [Aquiflexum gelatinilyticum]|uniref:glycosyltransferase n=1 Tax=Aquiflexum gelatinilyticum TaxID=2961943 RepID=UPI002168677C|nr:glycosyltransferase [Aquiflexum gelatinilyticum]MCS4436601.1 glycosyltransferase [Aquiflexum gelatinilyticum]